MYRISFTGDRKPETVSDIKGKRMYDDWQSGEMPERVEIRTGLTVERRTIREIEHVPEYNPNQNQLSNDELRRFELTELKDFLDDTGGLTPVKEIEYLVSKSLISVVMHKNEYKTASDATLYVRSDKTAEYTRVIDILSQWKTYHGKKLYAEKRELEELERIANEHPIWPG